MANGERIGGFVLSAAIHFAVLVGALLASVRIVEPGGEPRQTITYLEDVDVEPVEVEFYSRSYDIDTTGLPPLLVEEIQPIDLPRPPGRQQEKNPPPADPAEVKTPKGRLAMDAILAASKENALKLSDSERLDALHRHAKRIESMSSSKSVAEIGSVLQKSFNTRSRAFEPVLPRPPGEFDSDSALIHSVIRKKGPDGKEKAYFVLVDKDGRTFEAPAVDESSASAIEKMGSSPLLRQLLQQAILPVIDRAMDGAAPPTITPNPAQIKELPTSTRQ